MDEDLQELIYELETIWFKQATREEVGGILNKKPSENDNFPNQVMDKVKNIQQLFQKFIKIIEKIDNINPDTIILDGYIRQLLLLTTKLQEFVSESLFRESSRIQLKKAFKFDQRTEEIKGILDDVSKQFCLEVNSFNS